MNHEDPKREVWLGDSADHSASLGLRAKQHTVVQGTMLRRRRKDQIKMRRERDGAINNNNTSRWAACSEQAQQSQAWAPNWRSDVASLNSFSHEHAEMSSRERGLRADSASSFFPASASLLTDSTASMHHRNCQRPICFRLSRRFIPGCDLSFKMIHCTPTRGCCCCRSVASSTVEQPRGNAASIRF